MTQARRKKGMLQDLETLPTKRDNEAQKTVGYAYQ